MQPSKHRTFPNGPMRLFFIFLGTKQDTLFLGCLILHLIFRLHFYNIRRMFWECSLNLKGKFKERSGNQKLTFPELNFKTIVLVCLI